ncbi:protein-glutamine gamma-glutamyltransferase K-like [Brachionichthys hirsutus]|uniref:protein-glutamine gamma-glutamyltransferase K-like n=1 Tax=Brachionichthys hirsutus TaxID=412623 RepID=UPI003604A328
MRSTRSRSSVGRFASATLELEEDAAEKMEEPKEDADALVASEPEEKGEDTNEEIPVTELLKVLSIDLMKSPSGENRTQHHTDLYQSDDFIFRRGQNFQMWMTLSRAFIPSTDKLHLELKTGPLPKVSKGSHVIIPLVEALQDKRWEAALVGQDGDRIKLSVNSPATAIVGRYRLMVETDCGNSQTISTHDYSNDIYLLFNPWCKDDAVFLESEDERQEYVLSDSGQIYYGSEHQIGVQTWDYGQFDEGILAICVFILERSGYLPTGWGDPVNVVRVISAMINSRDDYGVLVGNWSGDYSDGTSPTLWSGSLKILREFHGSNGTPVQYGQCWVFAGVFTTVLRCIGIPSRTVTNFSSAHDTDVSLTTDIYLDEDLDPIDHLNSDSIWNFHVWNDCWMARPDLPPGYGGWQVVDATPQETSHGTYRCGPASLAAIRSGQVYLKHDTTFVFAEVNSDKIYWQRNKDGTFTQIQTEKRTVGHFISTKSVGSEERNDITHLYKHREGTELERISVETACSYGSKAGEFSSSTSEDVSIEVTMNGEDPKMGQDVSLLIKFKNSSSKQRKVLLHSTVAVIYYTGVHKVTVRKDKTKVTIKPRKVNPLEWKLKYEEYRDQLIDQASLMLTLTGRVSETQQVLATQFSFRLRTPDIIIVPLGKAVVGEKMAVKILFTNPLPQELKDVIFHVEGLGISADRMIHFGDIGSHASVSLTEEFIPTRPGLRKCLVSLDCKELTHVHGVADITVLEKNSSDP